MASTLPKAQVIRKYIDESFDALAPILVLRWQDTSGPGERLWELPEGMCVVGAVPRKLGLRICRLAADRYAVRLLWEGTQLNWSALPARGTAGELPVAVAVRAGHGFVVVVGPAVGIDARWTHGSVSVPTLGHFRFQILDCRLAISSNLQSAI